MKNKISAIVAVAILFALSCGFSTELSIPAYYDSNGSAPGGATLGWVHDDCAVSSGTICTIITYWAFDTPENAEASFGADTSSPGLMKRP